jgi:hypothetical protein
MGQSGTIASMRKIMIVSLEPPPLTLTPALLEILGGGFIGVAYPPEGAIILALVSGIVVLVKRTRQQAETEQALKIFDEWNHQEQTWIPTRALAQEAAKQASAIGHSEIILAKELHTLSSLTKKERSWHMENWYAPLREWYNQDISPLNYEGFKRQGIDGVLEVGILNYEIYRDHLFMQVMNKLIDASTGRVAGRARSLSYRWVGPPRELFMSGGEKFKNIFMEEGVKLLQENLRRIGFPPH